MSTRKASMISDELKKNTMSIIKSDYESNDAKVCGEHSSLPMRNDISCSF